MSLPLPAIGTAAGGDGGAQLAADEARSLPVLGDFRRNATTAVVFTRWRLALSKPIDSTAFGMPSGVAEPIVADAVTRRDLSGTLRMPPFNSRSKTEPSDSMKADSAIR